MRDYIQKLYTKKKVGKILIITKRYLGGCVQFTYKTKNIHH